MSAGTSQNKCGPSAQSNCNRQRETTKYIMSLYLTSRPQTPSVQYPRPQPASVITSHQGPRLPLYSIPDHSLPLSSPHIKAPDSLCTVSPTTACLCHHLTSRPQTPSVQYPRPQPASVTTSHQGPRLPLYSIPDHSLPLSPPHIKAPDSLCTVSQTTACLCHHLTSRPQTPSVQYPRPQPASVTTSHQGPRLPLYSIPDHSLPLSLPHIKAPDSPCTVSQTTACLCHHLTSRPQTPPVQYPRPQPASVITSHQGPRLPLYSIPDHSLPLSPPHIKAPDSPCTVSQTTACLCHHLTSRPQTPPVQYPRPQPASVTTSHGHTKAPDSPCTVSQTTACLCHHLTPRPQTPPVQYLRPQPASVTTSHQGPRLPLYSISDHSLPLSPPHTKSRDVVLVFRQ